ncbi:SPOR domain-containing protein [Arthrobacter sulfonylureivorans]|nr:SPOR domain-containing protein [Arthrobacter sulfonylureivorans]
MQRRRQLKEAGMADFWYNVVTHQVEAGAQSDWTQLIGPYATREEAEHALEKVHQRNEEWEAEDD